MKGLDIAEKYYFEVGKPAIQRELPDSLPFLAAGLCGDGSECFGYDDAVSRDHDFGPGFCIWLDDDAWNRYGARLQQVYDSLPGSFDGISARKNDPHSGKRVGVFRISEFYESYLGSSLPPETPAGWLKPEECRLAQCTNGKVFEDAPGVFSALRDVLLGYYPEKVRLIKIIQELHLVSQSGQYNYARCMERGDYVAADLCLHEFISRTLHLVHLLDRKFEPYYKWSWRSFCSLPDAKSMVRPLERLTELPDQKEAWLVSRAPGINFKDEKVLLIESVCREILRILRNQSLTDLEEPFLDAHLDSISHKIRQSP